MTDGADNDGELLTGYPVANIVASLPTVSSDSRRSAPIFLHSSFRTGSTWLWQKLRAAPTTLAYYEIFNENLKELTPEQARLNDFSIWASKHPIASPYFLEFLPLLGPEGGIPGFDKSMGYVGTIPPSGADGDLPPEQYAYVDRLISAARAQHRIPVLSCTRTLGRARAFRRAFGGQTILLHRNLFHQWSSYCFQAENGNPSFIEMMCRIVLSAEHDPYLRGLRSWFELQEDPQPSREALFPVFVLLHLYLYSIAFDTADLIIDTTEIAANAALRRRVEQGLSEMVGHPISLSDAQSSCEPTTLDIECPRRMRDTIEQFAKLIPTSSTSPEAVDFIEQAKERALTEWDRCEFFTRRTRKVLMRKIDDASSRVEEQRNENGRLGAEIERLTEERDAFLQGLAASEAARADLGKTVAQLSAGREMHEKEIRRLTEERAGLTHSLSASNAARAQLDKTVAELWNERARAVARATEAAARQDALEQELAAAKADHERSLLSRLRQRVARKAGRHST